MFQFLIDANPTDPSVSCFQITLCEALPALAVPWPPLAQHEHLVGGGVRVLALAFVRGLLVSSRVPLCPGHLLVDALALCPLLTRCALVPCPHKPPGTLTFHAEAEIFKIRFLYFIFFLISCYTFTKRSFAFKT